MKIQITKDIGGYTSVKVDGVELNKYVSEFCLTQDGHTNTPVLILKMPILPLDELEVDLPDVVINMDKL